MDDFRYKKKLGQNFLQDSAVLNNIINYVDAKENDLIIEIGPGSGALTNELLKLNTLYLGYEIDGDTKRYLEKYESDKHKFIYDDFLKRNISEDIKKIHYEKVFIVANIPYYITTPIITKIINEQLPIYKQILMVQDEVADRLCAKPKTKNYGYITAYINYFYNITRLFKVSRNSFKPIPNVDSAVILFENKVTKKDIDIKKYNKLLKDSFLFKRKTIKNNLKSYDINKISYVLDKNNLSLQSRPEEISSDIYIEILEYINH